MNKLEEHRQVKFELRNVGSGSVAVDAATLAEDSEYTITVLLRSHYCPRSRKLIRSLIDNHEAFWERSTAVVPVLPAIRERARLWDQQYDLPFPLLVDPNESQATTSEFGALQPLREECDSLPAVALCECRSDGLWVVEWVTETATDVPTVESVVDRIDSHRNGDRTER